MVPKNFQGGVFVGEDHEQESAQGGVDVVFDLGLEGFSLTLIVLDQAGNVLEGHAFLLDCDGLEGVGELLLDLSEPLETGGSHKEDHVLLCRVLDVLEEQPVDLLLLYDLCGYLHDLLLQEVPHDLHQRCLPNPVGSVDQAVPAREHPQLPYLAYQP